MALMAVAARATNFDTSHTEPGVLNGTKVVRVKRLKEARPACSRVKFGIGTEERQVTQPTVIYPGLLVIQQRAAEREFCTVIEQYTLLFGAQAGSLFVHLFPGPRRQVIACGRSTHRMSPQPSSGSSWLTSGFSRSGQVLTSFSTYGAATAMM